MSRLGYMLGTLVAAAVVSAALWPSRPPFLLGGIQVNEPDHEHWFAALADAGMNTVSVTVYAKQGEWDADHLWWEEREEAVLEEIRGAKARGFHVVLIPRVALDHAFEKNRFLWHGMIWPRTAADLASWFDRYGAFVDQWARIAAEESVDLLALGSELNSLTSTISVSEVPPLVRYYLDAGERRRWKQVLLEQAPHSGLEALGNWAEEYPSAESFLSAQVYAQRRWASQVLGEGEGIDGINSRRRQLRAHWRHLIDRIRRVYSGPLTYAANFDQYREIAFWDALDWMGINAYFSLRPPLSEKSPPESLSAALEEGWEKVFSELERFRSEQHLEDRPLLFTEIGYTHRANSTIHPWAGDGFSLVETPGGPELFLWSQQPRDFTERALAFRALHEVHEARQRRVLRGLLYWKLSTVPSHLKIEPFVHLVAGTPKDPLAEEMKRFIDEGTAERWKRGFLTWMAGHGSGRNAGRRSEKE